MTSLIAMQKVVGSNPISRFFENALHVGGLASGREAGIQIDMWGLAAIPANRNCLWGARYLRSSTDWRKPVPGEARTLSTQLFR
jgi:hypothetical protein